MIKHGWIPPRSPYSLLQEDLWSSAPESEWLILVACMMLNCTRRKQVEGVLPEFRRRWPTPPAFLDAPDDEVRELIRPLGFASRRTANLKKMTAAYLEGRWQHARELPGVGDYAAAAHDVFCRGEVPLEPPNDHALKQYVIWYNKLFRPGK